jgi:hypothetical protein
MRFSALSLFLGSLSSAALAGGLSEIELLDGSKLYGEIVSVRKDIYRVESPSLGTIDIDSSKIRLIRLKPTSAQTEAQTGGVSTGIDSARRSEIEVLQKSMVSDQATMSLITSLQNDPEVQALLQDPAIMSAVTSADVTTLMANPQFLKLLQNPKIQEIEKKAIR